jgi:hypothetical protein
MEKIVFPDFSYMAVENISERNRSINRFLWGWMTKTGGLANKTNIPEAFGQM